MGVRDTSVLFQHRYYRINKTLLQLTGQWPYQSTLRRSVLLVLQLLIFASTLIPTGIAAAKHFDDWYIFIECMLPLTFGVFCVTKMFSSTLNSKKMLSLLNRMRTDWEILARNGHLNILHEYANVARWLTILYTVGGYAVGVLFTIQPVLPKIVDILLRNGTEPGEFPIPVDFVIIDVQKYYFYMTLQYLMVLFTAFSATIAYDSMFLVYVYHGCGLYAALGHKLERLGKSKRSIEVDQSAYALDQRRMDIKDLASCIDRHNDAIGYADLIEETYSWCFLLIVVFNTVLITVLGLEIIVRTIEPQKILRFVVTDIVAVGHLFIECYMGQILMDHSISIRYHILNCEWYTLPLKSQTELLLMTIRCNVPNTITAGKIVILSMEKFNSILKTSLSYIMVLRSI